MQIQKINEAYDRSRQNLVRQARDMGLCSSEIVKLELAIQQLEVRRRQAVLDASLKNGHGLAVAWGCLKERQEMEWTFV